MENRRGAAAEFKTNARAFRKTPLMIGDALYLSTPYNRVVALIAEPAASSGPTTRKPTRRARCLTAPASCIAASPRGATARRQAAHLPEQPLLADLAGRRDGQTGRRFRRQRHRQPAGRAALGDNPKHYTNTSPPVVYKDLVILGNGVADRLVYRKDPPGDVRAFDARTGKLVWTFHTVPLTGEFGNDTWGNGSGKFTGHTNVWAPMTLDDARGLLYLPVSTPSNDFYGGARPGQNLFAESLVCLDAATGKRKWHFQMVHHGIWDYDLPAPPVLATIIRTASRSTPSCN